MRSFDRPGRSVVHATEAMAATSHPLATGTAIDILRRGGTAMDAAIAAAAVLAVVEPAETGIGGDCFILYAPEGRVPPVAFNGSGRAPAAADRQVLADRAMASIPNDSSHAVTVPGAVDAWWRLHERFGRLDWAELLRPAISYAEGGYVVHERVAREWALGASRLMTDPNARATFLIDDAPPSTGDRMRNPALAKSLALIAKQGRAAFYEGELAEAMVRHLGALGGLHTLEDFAATQGDFVAPISVDRRGRTVFQLPPNTQGAIALLMLRLLDACGAPSLDFLSPERIHLCIEAARIAYARRDLMLGDEARSDALLRLIDDEAKIARLSSAILPGQRNEALPTLDPVGSNTVYLTVVDRDRNVASFINSIYHSFGSGICPPGTGILLQNRGVGFSLVPSHPNAFGPRRRPMHTIIPGMVGQHGRACLSFGVMGGDYQPMGHVHVLTALYDGGFDVQAACDAPRFLPVGSGVEVESGLGQPVLDALAGWGHRLRPAPDPLGGAQMIELDWGRGVLSAGSDPRKDGLALGF